MHSEINQMSIKFQSRSNNEAFARQAVAAFAAQLDPTIEEINDIKTAVSEAVTNCIVHAYRDTLGYITVAAKLYDDGEIQIVVRDKGCGIADIQQARQPMFTTGDAGRSGMGFTIMESFMDRLRVRSREGVGTQVTMTKRIAARLGQK
ncbi:MULTISPECIES: anti-sigma F factor [Butyricicoccus]|uniref:Anti-sigma F factor n=1 Tax=Butyricicoccus porcorum TaxID=1945634 RepID=A0A252F266_9FIRM|nr:anti-sigma F factor [Butyricicoccus porcorum]MCI6927378.1 anti-sigma F factor [Butyricicoccus porcorum]MDD6986460.1 anti-sigma F factor [Butyricicoccus porcorum]MDY4483767.1 anti-sigma F factor [Butyricicoccus porcorum]OUM19829.1 anti-sigma F factor [Butyricicoccus porcorum]